jgi:hypothetical protein
MTQTGQNRSSRTKTCPSATLFTTNLTWTNVGSKPGLHDESPAINRLHEALNSRKQHLETPSLPHGKHSFSITKANRLALLKDITVACFGNRRAIINAEHGREF